MKHIKIIKEGKLTDVKNRGCGECQTSCQSACKTSCTVGNQKCKQTTEK
ncbi:MULTISPECIES: six-cysteine ranthipeptide SCIFF [Acetobacterium]|uniref:Six-cysteine peptide SCIFF n=4 Tax=Acetobacterium TaxID=33951 RepID=A0A923I506_9FIRM|nr:MULTISPECIES: six-cysteine ranthipeptide SCIFF [Acetobacterium]MBI4856058.1 six-cysteine peptide SCIFF [Acetobacterium woodii]MBU4440694.1 six-cysteine ranthipeptide SCIFF [Bacillota bacterium]PKM48462.1 MAG: six-cysteine peptide SCIFF [Firmicutes bacterium HGW-Firmicutes-6]MBC3797435.1 six-cysteine peptide SCIFF [Acetobacterium tundrae]MBC3889125.1 six-cysteine peptide SCIFF [Acetobacterium paludosum]